MVAAFDDPSKRMDFYRLLMASKLSCLGYTTGASPPDRDGGRTAGEKTKLHVVSLRGTDGVERIPIFTSQTLAGEAPRTWTDPRVNLLELSARDLFEALPAGVTFILNPNSAHSKQIEPAEVEALLNGSIERLLAAGNEARPSPIAPAPGEKFYARAAQSAPPPLTQRLIDFGNASQQLDRIYVLDWFVPGRMESPALVIGLRVRAGAKTPVQTLVRAVGIIAGEALPGQGPFDVFVEDPSRQSPMHFDGIAPIFARKGT